MHSHRSWARDLAVATALAGALAVVAASAAEPESATLTLANGKSNPVSYVGGPYSGTNLTPIAEPVCDPATCDSFTLNVSLPDNYAATHPDDLIVIEVQWPNTSYDFDVYLRDADGAVVDASASGSDPEAIVIPAGAGTRSYTIESLAFTAVEETLTGTIYLLNVVDPCVAAGGQ